MFSCVQKNAKFTGFFRGIIEKQLHLKFVSVNHRQLNCIRLLVLVVLVVFSNAVFAQEMQGVVNSNYSGITGRALNPSSMVNSKLYMDFNVVGTHVFAENDYVYTKRGDVTIFSLLSKDPNVPVHGEKNRSTYDKYNKDRKNAFVNVALYGPSFMVSQNDQAFGFHTAVRSSHAVHQLPYHLGKFMYEEFKYKPLQNIRFRTEKDFSVASMTWAEIGFSYAAVLYKMNRHHISAGITVKRLLAYEGAYLEVDDLDYMIPNRDTAIFYNINATAGMALPWDYYENEYLTNSGVWRGTGWGFDLGFTYQWKLKGHSNFRYKKLCQQRYVGYRYKVGVSFLDLGRVKFTDNARKYAFENNSAFWDGLKQLSFDNIDLFMQEMSTEFTGDPDQLWADDKFSIALPSAVSVQFDYNYNSKWYFNATLVKGMRMGGDGAINRPTLLAAAARYESPHFDFTFPVSLYEYKHLMVGSSARFHNVIIGSDNLLGMLGLSDIHGADFYIMLKISLRKGYCGSNNRKGPCGNFEF